MYIIFNKGTSLEKIYEIDSCAEKALKDFNTNSFIKTLYVAKKISLNNTITANEYFADILDPSYQIYSVEIQSNKNKYFYSIDYKNIYKYDMNINQLNENTLVKYLSLTLIKMED